MIQSILVPVDGSESSKIALDLACEIALRFDAELSLLHVVEVTDTDEYLFMGSARVKIPGTHEQNMKTGQSVVNAATEIAKQHGCDVKKHQIVSGSAANAILDYVENHSIDTIVIGSRGLGNMAGLLLGSVSHKVAHLAKCTCITVR